MQICYEFHSLNITKKEFLSHVFIPLLDQMSYKLNNGLADSLTCMLIRGREIIKEFLMTILS